MNNPVNDEPEESRGPSMSVNEAVRVIGRYKNQILLTIGAVAMFWLIAAIAALVFAPGRKIVSLPFRLEFKGADRGEYPNGTRFSASEVVSTPVLLSVYNSNNLRSFLDYQTFKNSIFVIESNPALESLEREYRSKLSDPKLTPVDRDRLEQEFQQKKASVARSDYAINYVSDARLKDIPPTTQVKVLTDILDTWARQTIQNKGVVLYDLPILSSGIFERRVLDSYDYVIALDVVRSKILRVISNIEQLSQIPGAKVVRAPAPSRASLAELRVRLEDSLKFQIEPLVGTVMSAGFSKNPRHTIEFLQTRLAFNEIERATAESRVQTMRQMLETYDTQNAAKEQQTGQIGSGSTQTVIPQFNDSFFDRLLALSSESNDTEFRQTVITSMQQEAMKVVPLQAEERYYQNLIESLRGFESRARDAKPDELNMLRTQVNTVVEDAIRATDEVNQIYRTVSENLNPSTVLYSTTAPPVRSTEHAIPISRLALLGLLLLLLTIPVAILGSLVHYRFAGIDDEEEDLDEKDQGGDAEVTAETHPRSISAG